MRRSPLLALATTTSAALMAALPGVAGATLNITIDSDSVNITDNTTSVGYSEYVPLTIDPKGPGPDDDQAVMGVDANSVAGGCTEDTASGPARCPLKSGQNLIRKIELTIGGNFSEFRWSLDLDRPGVAMEARYTGGAGTHAVDASPTDVGNATISVTGGIFSAGLRGGGGDDSITGNDFNNVLDGGPGDDALIGLDGSDTLLGGAGDDAIVPGEGAADLADGGEGTRDALGLGDLPFGLEMAVSLDGVNNDGGANHALQISGIEDVGGSPSNDRITGDAGFNHLSGFGGNDVIDGAGGGHDVLRGNAGDDQVIARDVPALFSDVACGSGADTAIVDFLDVVAPDCESVDRSLPAPGTSDDTTAPTVAFVKLSKRVTPKQLRRGLRVRVETSEPATLLGELYATARRARLAAPFNLLLASRRLGLGGGTRALKLKPPRRLIAGARSVRVRVTATDAAGNERTLAKTLKVGKRRKKKKQR